MVPCHSLRCTHDWLSNKQRDTSCNNILYIGHCHCSAFVYSTIGASCNYLIPLFWSRLSIPFEFKTILPKCWNRKSVSLVRSVFAPPCCFDESGEDGCVGSSSSKIVLSGVVDMFGTFKNRGWNFWSNNFSRHESIGSIVMFVDTDWVDILLDGGSCCVVFVGGLLSEGGGWFGGLFKINDLEFNIMQRGGYERNPIRAQWNEVYRCCKRSPARGVYCCLLFLSLCPVQLILSAVDGAIFTTCNTCTCIFYIFMIYVYHIHGTHVCM